MHGNLEPEENVFGRSITFYSTDGCFYCEQMKLLMERASLDYNEIKVTKDESDAFLKKYPNAVGYPYVIIDGKEIGGLVETAKKFVKEGLVSSGKR